MPEKESISIRIYKPLMDAVRQVKEETGKNHTLFIEEAIDEKLLREGHTRQYILEPEK